MDDVSDLYKHLTNTVKSVEDENFNVEEGVRLLDDLKFNFMHGETSNKKYNNCDEVTAQDIVNKIRSEIHVVTEELFTSFENEYTIFAPMSNCFEIYGLDFMIDNNLQLYLLEVNPGPGNNNKNNIYI